MRIISGKFKGHSVKFPKSKLVRPTTDRNKESIFNYLNNIISFDGLIVGDLYAGSGSLGLEALSRGADSVHFVEKNFKVSRVLKENISKLRAENQCKVFVSSCNAFASKSTHEKYGLILADPPFFKNDIYEVVKKLFENDFLSNDGILILERSVQTKDSDVENLGRDPIKKLGDSLIYLFEKNEDIDNQ